MWDKIVCEKYLYTYCIRKTHVICDSRAQEKSVLLNQKAIKLFNKTKMFVISTGISYSLCVFAHAVNCIVFLCVSCSV